MIKKQPDIVRLDKWLWAARFYKTRQLAQQAILGGKVRYNQVTPKPSKAVEVNSLIRISMQGIVKEVVVLSLSSQRGSAKVALLLYQETKNSIEAREKLDTMKAAMPRLVFNKPNKKQRRQIIKFKGR